MRRNPGCRNIRGNPLICQSQPEAHLIYVILLVSVASVIASVWWARTSIREAAARAEEANQAKDRFLATMSHEFRTPLAAVVAYTDLLDEGILGPVGDRQKAALKRLRAANSHLTRLVNDVLDISRFEAGRARVEKQPFDAATAARESVAMLQPLAGKKGLRIVLQGDDALACIGDDSRFRQIVTNLVSNAIKFTDGGGTITVRCAVHDDGHRALVSVADDGVGIDPRDQERIFRPFEQASGHNRSAGGSGLGLAISAQLAGAMGGSISLESARGIGSTFTVLIPLAEPRPRARIPRSFSFRRFSESRVSLLP